MAVPKQDNFGDLIEAVQRLALNRADLRWQRECSTVAMYTVGCTRCHEVGAIYPDVDWARWPESWARKIQFDCACLRTARERAAWREHFGLLAEMVEDTF